MNKNKLLQTIEVVMNCRFEGHRRLETKSKVSVLVFIIFSLIVVAGSVILLTYSDELSEKQIKFISVSLVLFSVNSLAFQLFEFSQRYEVRSQDLYSSGVKLAALKNKLDMLDETPSPSMLESYENILETHSENHDNVDYHVAKKIIKTKSLSKLYATDKKTYDAEIAEKIKVSDDELKKYKKTNKKPRFWNYLDKKGIRVGVFKYYSRFSVLLYFILVNSALIAIGWWLLSFET